MIETHNYYTDTATVATSIDNGLRIDTLLLGNACVNALNYSLINITFRCWKWISPPHYHHPLWRLLWQELLQT